ncbi:MAG TPA: ABC transporter ATP-binding protein [Candidatus Micrarchaeaceae archaeon]|nr:ABC transporter ATP-binding protein [Candidatus Micrarchaeaceae archaeon]
MSALLEVEGVSKSFGGLQALNLCTLSVESGKVTGLIGPNGSGKTTLFNVMTGYEPVRQGTVRFKGDPITNLAPDRVFKLGIGRTFQLTRIFPRLTTMENMLIATQHREGWLGSVFRTSASLGPERDRAMELLQFVGIEGLANQPAGNLSYGQRKLLEFAYVLVADPDVLLLDEPAGGVNPSLINHLAEKIRELNDQGKTFLVVEHNMEFVMGICDSLTVMHQGAAIMTGTPAEVRAHPKVLDAYLGGEDGEDDA